MATRVLVIEADGATGQSTESMLASEGFNVYAADLGEDGADLGRLYDYDIILLDPDLPDISGYEVMRRLSAFKVTTPVLLLSDAAEIGDNIEGLAIGTVDHLAKPFHKDELVARIRTIVSRPKRRAEQAIHIGDLVVRLDTKTVEVGGTRVHLGAKEYQTLEFLALHKGTVLTKNMVCSHLYGSTDTPEPAIVERFVTSLRKKLANASNGKTYIETVSGRGYVLREPRENDGKISA